MDNFNLKIEKIPITRNEVFDKLFDAIIFGYFSPGEQLIERELSKAIGVSRTPIREALRELERIDLVSSLPYKGVVVNKISIKKAREICIVRMYLEKLAIELCIKNINKNILDDLKISLDNFNKALLENNLRDMLLNDNLFHSIIYESAGNDVLQNVLKNLRALIGQCRLITLPNLANRTHIDHANIYEAIKKNDVDLAKKYIQEHIEHFYNILKKEIKNNSCEELK